MKTMNEGMRRNDSGFLYIELIVALGILATALVAIGPLFIVAARENAASSDLTYAATLAGEKAEVLKQATFDSLVAGSNEQTLLMRRIKFKRTWVVEVDQPHAGMKTVTVTVEPLRQVTYGKKRVATVRFYRAQ